MFRLIFPEISFSGRLSRARFWREIAVAAFTAPIVVGMLAYVLYAMAAAAEAGANIRGTALAGAFLTGIGLRNTVAFTGIVQRRANDIGESVKHAFRSGIGAIAAAMFFLAIGTSLAPKFKFLAILPILFY